MMKSLNSTANMLTIVKTTDWEVKRTWKNHRETHWQRKTEWELILCSLLLCGSGLSPAGPEVPDLQPCEEGTRAPFFSLCLLSCSQFLQAFLQSSHPPILVNFLHTSLPGLCHCDPCVQRSAEAAEWRNIYRSVRQNWALLLLHIHYSSSITATSATH